MKKIIPHFILLLTLSFQISAQIISDPQVVALQDPWGNARPRIALNADGNPVVIWTNVDTQNIYCSVKSGDDFSTPLQLNPDGVLSAAMDWQGPDIASSGNHIAVVFKQTPEMEGHIYLVRSEDGGMSWGDTIRVATTGTIMLRFPALAMDNEGNPYVLLMQLYDMGASGSEWAVVRSEDEGQTFLPAVSASNLSGVYVCDCCPGVITVNGDDVAVVYRNNDENVRDMRATISTNGAQTFSITADMDDVDWMINACPSSGPSAYIANEILHSTWMSQGTGDSRVYYSSYNIGTGDMVQSVEISPALSSVVQNHPSIAGNESSAAVVWQESQSAQTNIRFAYSASPGIFLADDIENLTSNQDGNQLRPHMVYSNGVYHIVYTDNGSNAVQYLTVSGFVRIEENSFENNFSIFPNPASDVLTMQFNSTHGIRQIEITDEAGRVCLSKSVSSNENNLSLDLSSLAKGNYTVRTSMNGKIVSSQSFIKQH